MVFENCVLFCGPEIDSCDQFVSRNLEQVKFQCWNAIDVFLQQNKLISNVYFTTQNIGPLYLFGGDNKQTKIIKQLSNQSSAQNWSIEYKKYLFTQDS